MAAEAEAPGAVQAEGADRWREASPAARARARRRQQYRSAATGANGDGALQLRARHLEEELQSLREAYARKIASTELRCEQLLREKDDEKAVWYREKKSDITRLQAGNVVMHAIFDRRRRKAMTQMAAEREEFDRQKAAFEEEMIQLKSEHEEACRLASEQMSRQFDTVASKDAEFNIERVYMENIKRKLEEEIRDLRAQIHRLTEDSERDRHEIEDLRIKLEESQRSEELANKNEQIEALEQELKKTKKAMKEQWHTEADALRQELQEYVKFIVHILPDDLQETVAKRVDEASSRRNRSPPRGRSPSRPAELDAGPRALPPVAAAAGGAGGWRPPLRELPALSPYSPPAMTPRRRRPGPSQRGWPD